MDDTRYCYARLTLSEPIGAQPTGAQSIDRYLGLGNIVPGSYLQLNSFVRRGTRMNKPHTTTSSRFLRSETDLHTTVTKVPLLAA